MVSVDFASPATTATSAFVASKPFFCPATQWEVLTINSGNYYSAGFSVVIP